MNEIKTSDIATLQNLVNQAEAARRHDQGIPYLVVPEDFKTVAVEDYLEAPTRIKSKIQFIALESFCRYVNQFKEAGTRIELKAAGSAVAVIDGDLPGRPRWEDQSADFNVVYSDRWNAWAGVHKKPFQQRQFAEFIEENLPDFAKPTGADMLNLATTLQAEQNSFFEQGVRLENNDVQLTYKKTTTAKAGQRGDMEIPSTFWIGIPVLNAEAPRLIPLRLRYELEEGRLTLTCEIVRKAALLEEVRNSIYAEIKKSTGIEPLLTA